MANEGFGLPPVEEAKQEIETEAQRIARLRAKAEAQAASEFNEDAVYAQLLAEARAKKAAELAKPLVEFATDTDGFPEEYDAIEVYRGRDKHDLSYVPLGLDGFVIKVPRGREVVLPHVFVTECLDQAIESITEPAIDARGNLAGITIRPAHRFPYAFRRKATKAEYQAFMATQRELQSRQMAQAA